MRDRQICIDCGKKSPETETNYTLISAQFGWRLSRRRAANGDFIVEWRCAECWRDHKKKTEEEPPSKTKEKVAPDKPAERHRALTYPVAHPAPRAPTTAGSAPPPRASSRPPPKPASSRPPPASRPAATPPPTPAPGVPRTRRG